MFLIALILGVFNVFAADAETKANTFNTFRKAHEIEASNPKRAIYLYRTCLASGLKKARLPLANLLYKQSNPADYAESISLYTFLAGEGDANAQYRLGYHYRVYTRDYEQAAYYYRLAAANGHTQAQIYLQTTASCPNPCLIL